MYILTAISLLLYVCKLSIIYYTAIGSYMCPLSHQNARTAYPPSPFPSLVVTSSYQRTELPGRLPFRVSLGGLQCLRTLCHALPNSRHAPIHYIRVYSGAGSHYLRGSRDAPPFTDPSLQLPDPSPATPSQRHGRNVALSLRSILLDTRYR